MRELTKKHIRKITPFVLSVVLVAILISYAPWGQVVMILGDFDATTIFILFGLSLLYYGLKAVRFWYLLIAMDIKQPFPIVALSYISAQPVSLLPGGEIYRSHALERQTGVPVQQSLPQFTMQGILEGAGLATVMIISAIALRSLRIAAIILGVLVIASLLALARGYLAPFLRILNRVPFINISEQSIRNFNKQHKAVLSWRWLPFMFAMSLLTELIGTTIAYVSVSGLGGHINVFQAGLMYVIPVVVGFFSLLPGGIGLSEQSAIGVLLLSNVTTALAVAATLIMRVTIVGLGVVYGVIALLLSSARIRRLGQAIQLL